MIWLGLGCLLGGALGIIFVLVCHSLMIKFAPEMPEWPEEGEDD